MKKRIEKNKEFLANIYRKGPFQGHGFTCQPPQINLMERGGCYTLSDKPVKEWVPYFVENYERKVKLFEEVQHDGVPFAHASTGTYIFAKAFGAEVNVYEGDTPPAATPFISNAEEADKVEEPDIWKSPSLYRVFEINRELQKELGKDVLLCSPDMQSGFDTLAMIWDKTDLMCSMMIEENKASVHRLNAKCASLFKKFTAEFRKEFPHQSPSCCPGIYYPFEMGQGITNDECGIISPETFEEFLLPELVDLSETFGGLAFHCCAKAEHQVESFKKIPNFYGYNRVCGWGSKTIQENVEAYGGEDAPVYILAWIEEKDIEDLVQNAPEGTRFIFQNQGAKKEDAGLWLERMRKLSPRTD